MTMTSTCAMIVLSSMRTKTLGTSHNFRLPATPVPPPEEAATHHNETFVMADRLDWTEIFVEDTNHPTIPDMTPITYTVRERRI